MRGNAGQVTPLQIRKLAEILEVRTGNYFNPSREGILERVFLSRVRELLLNSPEEYLNFLGIIPQYHTEWKALISAVTNNESYFFREYHHFTALSDSIRSHHLGENPAASVRILSAACSDGQEPYSIAIFLNELKTEFPLFDYQVYAVDIDESALTRARTGRYNRYSFREERGNLYKLKYFSQIGDDYQVVPQIKTRVNFLQGNLISQMQLSMLPKFDFIFCRNVLIYFRKPQFDTAMSHLFNLLAPGGFLFLGHSESALGFNPMLAPVSFDNFIGYRRVGL